jgi:hypothetical protein
MSLPKREVVGPLIALPAAVTLCRRMPAVGILAQLALNDGYTNVLSRNRSCAYDGGRSDSDSDGDGIKR